MQEQIKQLKRENQDLKDLLQDVSPILSRYKSEFGVIEGELLAKVNSVAGGTRYNAAEWDLRDRNGEQ